MKPKNLTFLMFAALCLLTNCSNDDDSEENETTTEIWNLKNVSGGFQGVDIEYENGIVSWQFIPETNSLIVESSLINTGPQSIYLPLPSGNYNYTLTESNGKTFIRIEGFEIFANGEYGRYQKNNNGELVIDQGEGSEANANDLFVLLFNQ